MSGGREAVSDPIGLIEVDLVGRLSIESVMGHFRFVPVDVEIDELLELREAFERMQVEPLVAQRTPECFDHGIAETDLDLGKHTAADPVGHQLVDSGVDVLHARIGDGGWRVVEILGGLLQDFARRCGCEPFRKAPRQDPAREVVDNGMQVAFRVIEKSDDGDVDVPVLVGVRCPDAGLGLFRIHAATRSSPTTLPDELGPGCHRCENLAGSLRIGGQSSKRHVPILGSGDHLLDGAHLGGGELRWMRARTA